MKKITLNIVPMKNEYGRDCKYFSFKVRDSEKPHTFQFLHAGELKVGDIVKLIRKEKIVDKAIIKQERKYSHNFKYADGSIHDANRGDCFVGFKIIGPTKKESLNAQPLNPYRLNMDDLIEIKTSLSIKEFIESTTDKFDITKTFEKEVFTYPTYRPIKSVCIMCNDLYDYCMYCGGRIGKAREAENLAESLENS